MLYVSCVIEFSFVLLLLLSLNMNVSECIPQSVREFEVLEHKPFVDSDLNTEERKCRVCAHTWMLLKLEKGYRSDVFASLTEEIRRSN